MPVDCVGLHFIEQLYPIDRRLSNLNLASITVGVLTTPRILWLVRFVPVARNDRTVDQLPRCMTSFLRTSQRFSRLCSRWYAGRRACMHYRRLSRLQGSLAHVIILHDRSVGVKAKDGVDEVSPCIAWTWSRYGGVGHQCVSLVSLVNDVVAALHLWSLTLVSVVAFDNDGHTCMLHDRSCPVNQFLFLLFLPYRRLNTKLPFPTAPAKAPPLDHGPLIRPSNAVMAGSLKLSCPLLANAIPSFLTQLRY